MRTPDDDEPDDDEPEVLEPSRTKLRARAKAYLVLAEQLAKGKHGKLVDPPFDATLREAIVDAQRLLEKARGRQIRRVAQLLREAGPIEELHAALAGRTAQARAKQEREQLSEAWRARLLEQGDAALTELMAAHPSADRQQLRQLIRQASRTPPDARSKRAATRLLRAVRALLEELIDERIE
ncbi:MAG: ribosome biogenesis factor YjgA [Enhygromyxa sp.]